MAVSTGRGTDPGVQGTEKHNIESSLMTFYQSTYPSAGKFPTHLSLVIVVLVTLGAKSVDVVVCVCGGNKET